MSIFQTSILKTYKQDESKIAQRWAKFQNYLSKVEFVKGVKEEKYQDGFLHDLFEECLGYTLDNTNPQNFNLEREKKNETDGKKADGVIHLEGKVVGIIELKDQKSKNLDAIEAQAFNYHNSHSSSKYIIISNFDELRFYIDKKTAYERFSLFNLNYDEFKKLHLILSYESIKEGLPLKLKEKSANFEQQISKELYRDFSIFRNHLFENIVKNNYTVRPELVEGYNLDSVRPEPVEGSDLDSVRPEPVEGSDLDKQTLLRLTQKLCDRIIFILFAEDRGLLRNNTIKEIREEFKAQKFTSYTLYDIYKFYFEAINKGNEKLGIPKYNGGLFAKDEMLDVLVIDDVALDVEAQKLSDYDFVSDISVNILGHIFEQSLTDLEELNASINDTDFDKKKSKRKKDGVFYTPEYITRYIVQNTLGKLCEDKKEELNITETIPVIASETKQSIKNKLPRAQALAITQYKQNLLSYREWLTNLKILDPACGSGAFLNQALEFLIKEHTVTRDMLLPFGDLTIGYEIETSILEHNLYGVDINEDAVEIARLSLWLRTAHRGRTLTNLSGKIVCANSLLAMPFDEGSFDVVIGNPPYVALNKIKDINYANAGFEVFEKTGDLLALFIEKGLRLTAEEKYFSFIVSNSWLKTKYGEPLKRFLEKNGQTEVLNFVGTQLFEDATVESCIVNSVRYPVPAPVRGELVEPQHPSILRQAQDERVRRTEITITNIRNFTTQNASVETITEAIENSSDDDSESLLMRKIESIGKPLKEWNISINRGILTGFNEAFIIDTAKKDELVAKDAKSVQIIKPILRGRDVQKYETNKSELWLIYSHSGLLESQYPSVHEHLYPHKEKLKLRRGGMNPKTGNLPYEWYQLQVDYYKSQTYKLFEKPKIIWGEISDEPKFAFDENNYFINDTLFAMTGKNLKYLLAFLNSKLSKWYFERISTTTGMGTNRWKKFKLELLPIAIAENETPFINLADEILETKPKINEYKILLTDAIKNDNFDREIKLKKEIEAFENRVIECEKEIDKMVYKLYGLSDDEIKIVESTGA